MLTNSDVADLTDWRRALHRLPEVSGQEEQTAATVVQALRGLRPDRIVTGLGGHGVAAVWQGAGDGPSVLFRAELDALPIEELSDAPHRSTITGKGHLCGHDGHMAILMGLARLVSRHPPKAGRVILMFQPAEEDGSGAAAVIADPNFADLRPDWAFSLHNMPGLAFGHTALTDGPVNCASLGLKIKLTGKTAHASLPETGISPALAVSRLIPALGGLGQGGTLHPDYRLVTITHARLGEPAFGIAPGEAEIWVTLRTLTDDKMAALLEAAMSLAKAEAQNGLTVSFTQHDDFAASVNDPDATARLRAALDALHMPHDIGDLPMRGSEDFGRFGAEPGTRGAMLFLGVGQTHPALHNPDYDFPDALIPIGARLFHRVLTDITG